MKRSIVLGAILLGAATLVPMAAQAEGWEHHGGRGDGWRGEGRRGDGWRGYEGREHGWGGPRLVFRPGYLPPPVYYAPPPVYYAPPPVYYRPQPTYVAPAYVAPYAAPSLSLGVNIPLR